MHGLLFDQINQFQRTEIDAPDSAATDFESIADLMYTESVSP